jgi:hypothetical protein
MHYVALGLQPRTCVSQITRQTSPILCLLRNRRRASCIALCPDKVMRPPGTSSARRVSFPLDLEEALRVLNVARAYSPIVNMHPAGFTSPCGAAITDGLPNASIFLDRSRLPYDLKRKRQQPELEHLLWFACITGGGSIFVRGVGRGAIHSTNNRNADPPRATLQLQSKGSGRDRSWPAHTLAQARLPHEQVPGDRLA